MSTGMNVSKTEIELETNVASGSPRISSKSLFVSVAGIATCVAGSLFCFAGVLDLHFAGSALAFLAVQLFVLTVFLTFGVRRRSRLLVGCLWPLPLVVARVMYLFANTKDVEPDQLIGGAVVFILLAASYFIVDSLYAWGNKRGAAH